MNRFFAGLLDRAEGRAPVLERRPRALFEPRPGGDARLLDSLEQDEMRVAPDPAPRAHVRETPAQASAITNTARNERVEETVKPRAAANIEAPRVSDDRPAQQRGTLVPEVPQIRARPVPPPDVSRPAVRSASVESKVITHESSTVTKVVEVQRAAERSISRAEPVIADRARVPRESRPSDAQPAARQITKVVEHSRMISAPPSRSTARATSESAVRLAKAQTPTVARRERQTSAAATPVQITIGRVEVRAVSGRSERMPAKAPAAPRLSLDDYLRQRSGASR